MAVLADDQSAALLAQQDDDLAAWAKTAPRVVIRDTALYDAITEVEHLAWAAFFGIFPTNFGDAIIVRDGKSYTHNPSGEPVRYKLRKKYR